MLSAYDFANISDIYNKRSGATGKADEDEDDVDNLLASMRSNSPDKRRGGAAGASGAARLEVEDF